MKHVKFVFKKEMFIRDITATASWQYKELVMRIVRMFREYFWDIIVMKKKKKRNDQDKRNPRNDFAWFARRFGFGFDRFGAFARFVSMVSFCCFGF